MKGAKPPQAPPPIPPVLAQNAAGDADSANLRRKARQQGTNFEDTILAGSTAKPAAPTVLGGY